MLTKIYMYETHNISGNKSEQRSHEPHCTLNDHAEIGLESA